MQGLRSEPCSPRVLLREHKTRVHPAQIVRHTVALLDLIRPYVIIPRRELCRRES